MHFEPPENIPNIAGYANCYPPSFETKRKREEEEKKKRKYSREKKANKKRTEKKETERVMKFASSIRASLPTERKTAPILFLGIR